jgi:hypothetical protein
MAWTSAQRAVRIGDACPERSTPRSSHLVGGLGMKPEF